MSEHQYRVQVRNRYGTLEEMNWRTWKDYTLVGASDAIPMKRLRELANDFPQADWRLMEQVGIRTDRWVIVKQFDAEEPDLVDDTEERVHDILIQAQNFELTSMEATDAIMAIIKEQKA